MGLLNGFWICIRVLTDPFPLFHHGSLPGFWDQLMALLAFIFCSFRKVFPVFCFIPDNPFPFRGLLVLAEGAGNKELFLGAVLIFPFNSANALDGGSATKKYSSSGIGGGSFFCQGKRITFTTI